MSRLQHPHTRSGSWELGGDVLCPSAVDGGKLFDDVRSASALRIREADEASVIGEKALEGFHIMRIPSGNVIICYGFGSPLSAEVLLVYAMPATRTTTRDNMCVIIRLTSSSSAIASPVRVPRSQSVDGQDAEGHNAARLAVGCIAFHEKAVKLEIKFISLALVVRCAWDRASMRTRVMVHV
jgi:hypothetical protein